MHAISAWNMECLLCGAPDSRWSVEHGVPTEVEYLLGKHSQTPHFGQN